MSGVTETLVEAGVRKGSMSMSLVKSHADFRVVDLPLERGDTYFCNFLGRVHSHIGGRGSDFLPTNFCR